MGLRNLLICLGLSVLVYCNDGEQIEQIEFDDVDEVDYGNDQEIGDDELRYDFEGYD